MKRNREVRIAVVAGLMAVVMCATVYAAPPGTGWPGKKGEVCWTTTMGTDESMVIAQVTNMGNAHYLIHGQAFRTDAGGLGKPLVPFMGSAEIDATNPADVRVRAVFFHVEVHDRTPDPDEIEKFSGTLDLNYDTLEGTISGFATVCDWAPGQNENPTGCGFMTLGDFLMTPTACP